MIDSAILVDWDDGHSPGNSTVQNKMLIHEHKSKNNFIDIFDDVLGDDWCSYIHEYSSRIGKPWGTYVTKDEVLDMNHDPILIRDEDPEKAIGLIVTRTLYFEKGLNIINNDLARIHGIAVWGLISGKDAAVDYHIDYAELYRYETGVICPPLYAGVLQVSDLPTMVGGDFKVNRKGLDHYRQVGYKACLTTPTMYQQDLATSEDWLTVPYRRNRAVLFDGNLPHTATKVLEIEEGQKRVVIGLNVFGYEVGNCCQRAPEHSQAFNRTVKLYQTMASLGMPITSYTSDPTSAYSASINLLPPVPDPSTELLVGISPKAMATTGVTVKDIMKNPGLAKLLVSAAKKVRKARILDSEAGKSKDALLT